MIELIGNWFIFKSDQQKRIKPKQLIFSVHQLTKLNMQLENNSCENTCCKWKNPWIGTCCWLGKAFFSSPLVNKSWRMEVSHNIPFYHSICKRLGTYFNAIIRKFKNINIKYVPESWYTMHLGGKEICMVYG